MFNRELNFSDIIFLAILCGIMSIIFGCSSAPKADVSKPKVYYCPSGHEIPMKNINKDIRAINTCLMCGAEFPYLETEGKRDGNYYKKNRQKNYGPASVYQSSTEVEVLAASGGFFEENDWGFTWLSWRYYDVDVDRDYARSIWSNRFNYNN